MTAPHSESHDPDIKIESDEDHEAVKKQYEDLKAFIEGLDPTSLRDGSWFEKLLARALDSYTKKVDAKYFKNKYPGLPPDLIVETRIKLAARYAAIAGGLSAATYTGVVAATIGTLGGASPLTVPAALTTLAADAAYISQLHIRLAYDISVLYGVPLDVEDPEDLWKLIRIAFTIKSGEAAGLAANKFVPLMVRPLIKRYFSGSVLAAARSLPTVGKFILQRNVIKIGIPLVGVPLAAVINQWAAKIAGEHARKIFRNEAEIKKIAERVSQESEHPRLLLWVAWLVVRCDGKSSDDETLFMRHMFAQVREHHDIVDEQLQEAINVQREDVWEKLAGAGGDISDLYEAAVTIANIAGPVTKKKQKLLEEIKYRCRLNAH